MHNNHVRLGSLEQLVVDDKGILDSFVCGNIGEALLLHTGGVQNVRAGDNLRSQLLRLEDQLAGSNDLLADILGESEGLGSNKLDADIVELEQLDEGVYGAAILEVTNEGNVEA